MTQTDKVLRHLRVVGPITPIEALREYGIMRLGARVWDLEQQGHTIGRKMVHGVNRFGESTRFCLYWLDELAESHTLLDRLLEKAHANQG
jgi:hypothetical protein